MRPFFPLLAVALGFAAQAPAQSCTNLCLLQAPPNSCAAGQSTTISGKVFAPNGIDPLPNVTVYIPNDVVAPFAPGIPGTCPAAGAPPSGSPLVGTTTGVDGAFIITNAPVGANIPIVAVTGKWRRQLVIANTTSCADTPININMPKNQTEGDIPKFAVATGSVDQVECVLRKVGLDDSEFTNSSGPGRINLYSGSYAAGARIDLNTPKEDVLMSDPTLLDQYDVLMLPCEGTGADRSPNQLPNLVQFANGGGRVYASHFSYSWMYKNPPFNTVVNWLGGSTNLNDGLATVDTTFSEGQTLASWLQVVGATTVKGQMSLSTIRRVFSSVNPPTQSWLTLNTTGNPVMQFVFDTPVGKPAGQCGRVLFNEYHVENTGAATGIAFPNECNTNAAMTPQEKLLEFSLFELTDDGGQATLTPATQDFGTEPIGFTSAPQTFTWTNNSTFGETVFVSPPSGDFAVASNNCGNLAGGASCTFSLNFTPTALGARTGILSVSAGAQTLTASLTGTGVPDLTASPTSLTFGNLDVGATASQTITVTSNAPSAVPFPALALTGDYSATSTCGSSVPANGTCTITVTFKPTTTGSRPGTLTSNPASAAYSGLTTQLSGNGVDFSISVNPTTGATIAGYGSSTMITATPIAGFNAQVSLTCTTNAVASTCIPALASFMLSAPVTTAAPITTTSKYVVVGYGGSASNLWFGLLALLSAVGLWKKRRTAGTLLRYSLLLCFMAASTLLMTGCSGKLPAQNPSFTAPGTYTYTMTATDGFLTHSTTYSLTVTAK